MYFIIVRVHEASMYTSKLKELILVKRYVYEQISLYILVVALLHKAPLLVSVITVPLNLCEKFIDFSLILQLQWFRCEVAIGNSEFYAAICISKKWK